MSRWDSMTGPAADWLPPGEEMKMADIKRLVITCGATEVAYDFDEEGVLRVYLGTYISEAPKTDTLQRTHILPGFTQWAIEGMTEWIRVTDRLPDNAWPCVVRGTWGCALGWNNNSGKWSWDGKEINNVTHWIPLPDPPEVDDA